MSPAGPESVTASLGKAAVWVLTDLPPHNSLHPASLRRGEKCTTLALHLHFRGSSRAGSTETLRKAGPEWCPNRARCALTVSLVSPL